MADAAGAARAGARAPVARRLRPSRMHAGGRTTVALTLALAVLPAIAAGEQIVPQDVQGPVVWGSAKNVTRLRNLWLADQPDPAALDRAKENGVGVVVNLREPGETSWDEKAAVEDLGLIYVAIPVTRDGSFSREPFARIDAVVREHPGEQILVHCSTGNRAAAWLATHLVGEHGMSPTDALAVAGRAGITKADVAAKVEQYLREERASDGATPPAAR